MASIKPLEIDGTDKFWQKIETAILADKMGVFSDNGLIFVAMSDKTKMKPFVRKKEELFSATIKEQSKNFKVIINGQFYGVSNAGIADALWGNDPVDPKETTAEGRVITDGKIIAGRAAPLMFFIANHWKSTPRYTFNAGSAPTKASSAVGGCGPIIINGLNYGEINQFSGGVVGKIRGEPTAKNKPHLKQRSNSTFASFITRPPYTGKTIIAHHPSRNLLFVLVLPHGAAGVSLPQVRDKLKKSNFNNAVFLDGSDSSLLVVDGKFITKAGENKDETNTVGIGFEIAS